MADRVTIQDIADALGVSRNTVSKAINNTGILADATREKILQKAVEMGYKQFSYVTLVDNGASGLRLQSPEEQARAQASASAAIGAQTGTQASAGMGQTGTAASAGMGVQTGTQASAGTSQAGTLASAGMGQAGTQAFAAIGQTGIQASAAGVQTGISTQARNQASATASVGIPAVAPVPVSAAGLLPKPVDGKNVIALFTTMFLGNSHFSSTMLDKCQRELSYLGYSLTMHRVNSSNRRAMTLPYSFDPEATAGIICIEMFDMKYDEMLCDLGIPVLFVDMPASLDVGALKADKLIMDNRSNIYLFMEEMVRRGKRHFGFIGEIRHCMSFFERYLGMREALVMMGLPCEEEYYVTENMEGVESPTSDQYQLYVENSIRGMKQLPDVFLCANDFIALDTLQVFRRLGITVPKDVWLCGFDDSPESRVVTPRLTSIHIHSQIMGYSAVNLLMSRIREPSLNYRTTYTETSLIYRESTGDTQA